MSSRRGQVPVVTIVKGAWTLVVRVE
ncbi:hypothetical protein RDI58_016204 [Solanum bulbocastanum]|uniref:Uncharacterized protein n=1 Tax=Solanum bulbocastanum TaxID=147425 RepID=A0AAN8TGX0_SOLBU